MVKIDGYNKLISKSSNAVLKTSIRLSRIHMPYLNLIHRYLLKLIFRSRTSTKTEF